FVVLAIDRHEHHRSAPLESRGLASFVTEEVLEYSEQKGSEAAFFRRGCFEGMSLQDVLEETLSQILRIGGFMSVPPDERVDRVPVGAAELLQRLGALVFILMLNVQN